MGVGGGRSASSTPTTITTTATATPATPATASPATATPATATNVSSPTSTAWQMEVLMERLRSKAGGYRSLVESAKGIKHAIMNKSHLMDPGERAALGSCLDSLQDNIKVTSLSAMVERLEAIAKQLGLKFTAGTTGSEVFVSCDMFYVEVLLDTDGRVRDVKVELAGDQNAREGQVRKSSPELMECLSSGDFLDFTAHLEGFSSIYQLNADKKIKSKAFQALQALETDLTKLFELAQETLTDPYKLVLKSPVGLLQRRRGGHAMRLVYFVSPYELLDVQAGRSITLTTETPSSRDLSHYVTVNIDASNSHKLQTTTLMIITKQPNGKKLPSFSGLTNDNSMTLPACFSLKLRKPMPVSLALIQRINEVTCLDCVDLSNQQSLISLIVQQATDGQFEYNSNRGLFVTLPDQQHCYFMTSSGELPGVMVSSIPFTHPTHITNILMCLRAQAAFNALISSCVRPASKQDPDSAYMFEVTAASHEYISVTFEHPQEESTATAEIDLTDLCNARCRLHTLTPDPGFCSEEYATKVLQRCLSIPVTMRAVMKKVAKEERKDAVTGGDSAVMMGGGKLNSDLNQNTKFLLNEYDKLGMRRDQLMAPHVNNLNNVVANTAPGHGYYNGPFPSSNHHSGGGDASTNPLAALGNAVQEAGTPLGYGALLGAVGHKPNLNQPFLGDAKPAKVRKKKPGLELDRKSPKYGDDVVIDLDERSSDSYLGEGVPAIVDNMKRRDVKMEKLQTIFNKRRSSSDSGTTDIGTSDLAALREQVYGAANAANFAKINSYPHKDSKDIKKVKKPRTDGPDSRKSPIVLDLTETESSSKKSGSGSGSSSSHSSSASLSAALLKRPGIEIIPIPGSTTPISIPSSITVTPVIKSADDKNKDKKDRRDKKDLDRKDKKRKRDDSPSSNSSSSSSSSSSKPSKVQIISSSLKHSSISSLEKFKSESGSKSGLTGITVKPSTPPYQSPSKKPSLSPGMTKSMIHNKLSVSPTHKPNKVIYSPNQSSSSHSSSPKGRSSPKPSTGSPKHPSMSPKHTSLGKPSMTQLKSVSPTFSKPSLSPKLSKSKDKERSSSSSPSRPLPSSSSSSSSMSSSSSSSSSSSLSKPKVSSSSSSSGTEKLKSSLSDALTITKVSTGESSSSSSLATSFLANSQSNTSSTSLDEKTQSFPVDKAKASPPKNRKGSSLSDIVDKLRAGVGGSADALTIIEKNEKEDKDSSKTGTGEGKKTGDKKEEFTVKPSTGLKLTINKAKMKEGNLSKSSSSSPNAKPSLSKSPSGLKPGVISGPASKKSIANLPPIPKLPPSSVSSVTATAVSPLGTTLPGVHSSPLQYQRERVKDKDREKDRSSSGERPRPKETSPAKSLNNSSSDGKKDSPSSKTSLTKPVSKDDHSLSQVSSHRKLESSESIDKLNKSVFQNDSGDKMEKSSTTKAEADSTHSTTADSSASNKLSDSFAEKGSVGHHNSLSGSNKLSTPVPSLSSGTQSAPSSSSDMIRQRDVFQPPQFKPSKESKEDAKPKSDIPLPLPRPPVSTSGSGAMTSSDHLPSDPMPALTATSSSASLNSSIPPPRQPPPPHSASNKSADDHGNSSSLDHHDKSKATESLVSSMPGPPPSSLAMSQPPPKTTTPTVGYPPASPSMSFKIVKSPAPVASPLNMISPHPVASPLNMISPHSVASSPSSCIIDDDLMDEALMGTRK
ncbi:mediator of RNA polymerase II transcription subunit 1-like isoform X1 [Penaeus japonicus]|uniref:mediator of RNA polymerase II transcription subunit 1-like isoform X1 n=2 Tax=Penaeus japonicus TaxID=27405 RepID=UPI001C717000|nr:mediator of RNA polymerase II transcription subunit 1-like isoform X1 [Penaeus japonicus]